MQTSIHIVPAAELQTGDRIHVSFLAYGDIVCPVSSVQPRGNLVDVSVRIGEDGPGFCTVLRADEPQTVIR